MQLTHLGQQEQCPRAVWESSCANWPSASLRLDKHTRYTGKPNWPASQTVNSDLPTPGGPVIM